MKVVDFGPIPDYHHTNSLRLLKRVDDYALYVSACQSFEVHLIRLRADYYNKYTDTLIKKQEYLAKSSEFGRYAWCYDRLSTVFRYFGFFGEYADDIIKKLVEVDYAFNF